MSHAQARKGLIIGCSRGIGAAIVSRFVSDGDDVAFTFSGSEEAAGFLAARTGARALRSDAADHEALLSAVRDVGPLDVLVFNAGLFVAGDPLALEPEAVDRMIDVNVRAPYHAVVEAGPACRTEAESSWSVRGRGTASPSPDARRTR